MATEGNGKRVVLHAQPRAVGVQASDGCTGGEGKHRKTALPTRFQLLYESRDGNLCLFETHEGHLAAVDASRFA